MGLGHSRCLQEAVCCGDLQRVRDVVSASTVNRTDDEVYWLGPILSPTRSCSSYKLR